MGYNGGRRWNEQRFEERWRRVTLARQMASRRRSVGFREKYGRLIAAGVVVFLIAGMFLLAYGHLRRNSYGSLMENAKTLYDREMYEDSLKAYTEVSLLYPDRLDPFLGVALASERTGRIGDAIEAYKRILDLEPFYDFAQNELTRVSLAAEEDSGDIPAGGGEDARKYDHAVQMGKIALLEEKYEEAARYFSDALVLHSEDAGVWAGLAEAQAGSGSGREAAGSLKEVLSRDPANEEAKSRLADIEKAAEKKAAEEKAAKEKAAKEKAAKEKAAAEKKKKRRPPPKKTRSAKSGKRSSPPAPSSSASPPSPSPSPAPPAPLKPAVPRASGGGES
jgi:tetratricopeptide (TPR) repeat protein